MVAFGKILAAAASAAALIATPTMAVASQAAPIAADLRASEAGDTENELFGNGGGGLLAIILIAVVIAIGIYIVVDDEEDEEPASP